jgi:molybdopterin biosynthesis enzyme MoaB
VPTFRAIVAADIPTLNQNTTGTASNVTGTVAIANGGTGQTTANSALNALLPSQALNI